MPKDLSTLSITEASRMLAAKEISAVDLARACIEKIKEKNPSLNAYLEVFDDVEAQARAAAAGDDEAMVLDEDFLAALEYAMPPSTGTGMGIDRLLMALTGLSIRETVLFPIVRRHVN